MKSILLGLILIASMTSAPAWSYLKGDYQLILTIVSERHTSIAIGTFGQKDACEKAGEAWVVKHDMMRQSRLREAFYLCVRTYN